MPTDPRQSPGTRGVFHIECQYYSDQPSEFLVSFGGKKDGVGAFYLGRATGFGPLAVLLRKVGVSPTDVDAALQVLMTEPHHEISDVVLTRAMIRELGL
jgi:hypothetical protein